MGGGEGRGGRMGARIEGIPRESISLGSQQNCSCVPVIPKSISSILVFPVP